VLFDEPVQHGTLGPLHFEEGVGVAVYANARRLVVEGHQRIDRHVSQTARNGFVPGVLIRHVAQKAFCGVAGSDVRRHWKDRRKRTRDGLG